jgi:hypothetical protein
MLVGMSVIREHQEHTLDILQDLFLGICLLIAKIKTLNKKVVKTLAQRRCFNYGRRPGVDSDRSLKTSLSITTYGP